MYRDWDYYNVVNHSLLSSSSLERILEVSMRAFYIDELRSKLNYAFLWIEGRVIELPSELIFVASIMLLSLVLFLFFFKITAFPLSISIFLSYLSKINLFSRLDSLRSSLASSWYILFLNNKSHTFCSNLGKAQMVIFSFWSFSHQWKRCWNQCLINLAFRHRLFWHPRVSF